MRFTLNFKYNQAVFVPTFTTMLKTGLAFCLMMSTSLAYSQGMKVTEVLVISHPELKTDVNAETFQTFVTEELLPELSGKMANTSYHLFKADRGVQKGKFLLVRGLGKIKDRKASGAENPVDLITSGNEGLQLFVSNPKAFTEYHLLGADKIQTLPDAGILGIHYIKVKKERSEDFEKLVMQKLHPAVSQLFPDMQLLYYKAVAGENAGSYITIFTIDSPRARDKYWPEGAPETDILKKTFKPLEGLAKELGTYFVEGSYLEPQSGGAAAYWESKAWTDFVHSRHLH